MVGDNTRNNKNITRNMLRRIPHPAIDVVLSNRLPASLRYLCRQLYKMGNAICLNTATIVKVLNRLLTHNQKSYKAEQELKMNKVS